MNTKRPGFSARQIIETEETELDLTFNSRYKVYFLFENRKIFNNFLGNAFSRCI